MDLTKYKFPEFKQSYTVLRKTVTADEYGAQSLAFTEGNTVHAMFTPVSAEATVAGYGESVKGLMQAIIYDIADIDYYDEFEINGSRYEVIEIENWNTHRRITVKRIIPEK